MVVNTTNTWTNTYTAQNLPQITRNQAQTRRDSAVRAAVNLFETRDGMAFA